MRVVERLPQDLALEWVRVVERPLEEARVVELHLWVRVVERLPQGAVSVQLVRLPRDLVLLQPGPLRLARWQEMGEPMASRPQASGRER